MFYIKLKPMSSIFLSARILYYYLVIPSFKCDWFLYVLITPSVVSSATTIAQSLPFVFSDTSAAATSISYTPLKSSIYRPSIISLSSLAKTLSSSCIGCSYYLCTYILAHAMARPWMAFLIRLCIGFCTIFDVLRPSTANRRYLLPNLNYWYPFTV